MILPRSMLFVCSLFVSACSSSSPECPPEDEEPSYSLIVIFAPNDALGNCEDRLKVKYEGSYTSVYCDPQDFAGIVEDCTCGAGTLEGEYEFSFVSDDGSVDKYDFETDADACQGYSVGGVKRYTL